MRQFIQYSQCIGRHYTVMNVHGGISVEPLCNMIIKKGTMCTEWYVRGWRSNNFHKTNKKLWFWKYFILAWCIITCLLWFSFFSLINISICTSASPLNRLQVYLQYFQYFDFTLVFHSTVFLNSWLLFLICCQPICRRRKTIGAPT